MRLYCTDSVQEKLKEYLLTSLNKLIEFLPCDDQSTNRKANEMSELGWHVARLQSELEKISADRDDLQRQLTEVRKKQNEWEQVLLDLLSDVHLEEKGTLCETLNSLIDCHVDIALDPLVSEKARELIQQGAKQAEVTRCGFRWITPGLSGKNAVEIAVITKNEEVIAALQEQVHTSNTDLKDTKSQRDQAIATAESLRAEYLKHKEMANANSDNAASLREQLRQMTVERDAVKEASGSQSRMIEAMQRDVSQLQAERDALSEQLTQAREDSGSLFREVAELRGDVSQLQAERDALSEQLTQAREASDMYEQENTALRDTIRQLRKNQIPEKLSGMLEAIRAVAEQATELI